MPVGCAIHERIVHHDRDAVRGEPHVELDAVRAYRHGRRESLKCVLCLPSRESAVSNDEGAREVLAER